MVESSDTVVITDSSMAVVLIILLPCTEVPSIDLLPRKKTHKKWSSHGRLNSVLLPGGGDVL